MAMLMGFWTAVSMSVFVGICWWAWSAGRQGANRESAMLPFALPDEVMAGRALDAAGESGTGARACRERNARDHTLQEH